MSRRVIEGPKTLKKVWWAILFYSVGGGTTRVPLNNFPSPIVTIVDSCNSAK